MTWSYILLTIETLVFWALVAVIAYWGRDAPSWTFVFLFYYMIYLVLRFIFMAQGADKFLYLNALNLFVLLSLFAWFYRHH